MYSLNLNSQLHASAVLSEDVLDYSVLFGKIADAYFKRKMHAEAKPIYELLGLYPDVDFHCIRFDVGVRGGGMIQHMVRCSIFLKIN